MKSMLACLTACLFVAAAAAQAQTAIQPIKMQMVQPNVQIAQVKDPALEVARLERENKRLREENEALKARLDALEGKAARSSSKPAGGKPRSRPAV